MNDDKTITLKFKEGYIYNYYKAFYERFGGTIHEDSYHLDKNGVFIDGSMYEIFEGVQMSLVNTISAFPISIDRVPDDNPDMLHLVLVNEGGFAQSYKDQLVNLEADSTKGVFFYNGLFPLVADFPANASYKAVAFKFSKQGLNKILPEATEPINKLFGEKRGIAYHTSIPAEVNRLSEDIFSFSMDTFGARAMVKVRGLEILVTIIKVLVHMENDELNGLHLDDYQRVIKIKNHLLASVNETISVEDVARDFAVSVSKLNRDFKSLYDTTIYKFFTYAKIDEAYRRLKTGKFSVSEVSYDMGYSNPAKFSNMFKKLKGMPPNKVIPIV